MIHCNKLLAESAREKERAEDGAVCLYEKLPANSEYGQPCEKDRYGIRERSQERRVRCAILVELKKTLRFGRANFAGFGGLS